MRGSTETIKEPSAIAAEEVGAVKLAIRGEFAYPVLGCTIHARPWPGLKHKRPKVPGWLKARALIIEDATHLWKDFARETMQECITFWDDLTFEDMWRDPEIGLALLRRIVRG